MTSPDVFEQTLLPLDAPGAKSPTAFKTISEAASETGVPQHVLRFWEGKFAQLRPLKRGGGRRYYRPEDMVLLHRIRSLLHEEGYTIKGVQKLLGEKRSLAPSIQPPAPDAFRRTRARIEAQQNGVQLPPQKAVDNFSALEELIGGDFTRKGQETALLRELIDELRALRLVLSKA